MNTAILTPTPLAAAFFTLGSAFAQQQIFVNDDAPQLIDPQTGQPSTNGNDGSSWALALPKLEAAFDIVNPTQDVEIFVAHGTYRPAAVAPGEVRTFRYDPAWRNVRVVGGFEGIETDIDAPLGSAARTFLDGSAFTLLNGSVVPAAGHVVTMPGGGIVDSEVTLERVVVQGGRADDTQLVNDPYGDQGGGLLIQSRSLVKLNSLIIRDNWAGLNGDPAGLTGRGGGVFVDGQPGGGSFFGPGVLIKDCRIFDNHAAFGAGMYTSSGQTIRIGNSRLSENGRIEFGNFSQADPPQCIDGGGVYILRQSDTLWNNTLFHDNIARRSGGGILWHTVEGTLDDADQLSMNHCTVTLNVVLGDPIAGGGFTSTTNRGAGIHVLPGPQIAGTAPIKLGIISNSIVFGNRVGTDATVQSAGGSGATLDFNFSDLGTQFSGGTFAPGGIFATAGAGNINAVPFFVSIPNRNLRLRALLPNPSPCIDAAGIGVAFVGTDYVDIDGDSVFLGEPLPLDLDAGGRSIGAAPDMGAFEN
jgi:hypothetical protein